ncbi:hypothetical protein SCA6_007950 [Theobroma cacao]|uniref:RING-type E3 ubiquitin transferase n=1 Tax=Theobroma cacao TaxID=3641 RepID=A0A061E952_THECC|nr:Uncharacterized protein TCM_011394 [Theobroma cacao]
MASATYDLDDLDILVYQPPIESEPHYPTPRFVQVEVTIILELKLKCHYCLTDQFIDLDNADPIVFQENIRFHLHVLKNNFRAYQILAPMLRRLGVDPSSPLFDTVIEAIIRHGRRMGTWESNKGRKVLPLHAKVWGTFVEHVNYEEEEVLVVRALEESASELETSNYNMVPAKESSIKKMLKRFRVEGGEYNQKGGENDIKRRRVEGENCVICLEELKVGSYASRMPCSHAFHGDCIEKWLKQSHYCPVCRFEMPTE